MGLYDRDYMKHGCDPQDPDDRPRRRPLWIRVTAVAVALLFLVSVIGVFF